MPPGGGDGGGAYRVQPDNNDDNVVSVTEWRAALGVSTEEELRAWDEEVREKDLAIHRDWDSSAWTVLKTGLDGFRAEWCKMPNMPFRLYRFTTTLEGVDAHDAYHAVTDSAGTPESTTFGDRSARFRDRCPQHWFTFHLTLHL